MSSVERLVRALERIRLRPRDLRVTPPVDAYYRALAELQEGERRRQYSDLAMALRDRAFRDSFLERPEDAALVQSTVSMTVLDGSSKTNVVPAEASAEIDVRLLPDETPTEFVENLREIIDDEAVEIATVLSLPPSVSPIDSPLFDCHRLGRGGGGRARRPDGSARIHRCALLPEQGGHGLRVHSLCAVRRRQSPDARRRRADPVARAARGAATPGRDSEGALMS